MSKGITTFSSLPGPSEPALSLRKNYFKHLGTTPNEFAPFAAKDPHVGFVAATAEGTLTTFHSIHFWSDPDNQVRAYASCGEALDAAIFVSLPKQVFDRVSIAVLSQQQAETAGFPTLQRLPTDCIDMSQPVARSARANKTTVTAAQLGFTDSTYPNAPVFAILPLTYPLIPGESFPLEGHSLSDEIPPETEALLEPGFRIWLTGIRSTLQHNNCACNKQGGLLFDPTDVISAEPDNNQAAFDAPGQAPDILALEDRLVDTFCSTYQLTPPSGHRFPRLQGADHCCHLRQVP